MFIKKIPSITRNKRGDKKAPRKNRSGNGLSMHVVYQPVKIMKIVYGVSMKKTVKNKTPVYVILHNIRSIHNVGSVFRTADAAGVLKIFLTGYTPTPHDRFGRIRKDLAKVALGAENSVEWEYVKNPTTLLKRLKKEKIQIIAVEQSSHAINYKKVKIDNGAGATAFLYGNEVSGVVPALLSLCDTIAEIPMLGKKESLNVSVAVGVTLFGILDL